MPLARYFTCVGALLLALLFLADWYFPAMVALPARADVDRTVIRLHSAHKWPEAIVFDTTLPTIVPPSAAAVAEGISLAAIAPSPKQAFALALPEMTPVRSEPASVPRKQAQRRRVRTMAASARTAANARRIASYETGGFRTGPFWGW
jgi:hypothetical protein